MSRLLTIEVVSYWLTIDVGNDVGNVGNDVGVEILDSTHPVKPWNSDVVHRSHADQLAVTWIGHSTVLVQMDNINVLTDPVFSQTCGPVRLPGVAVRYRHPACSVSDLPRIDAVLISHNHYDHLDAQSVADLNQRFGAELCWFVPSGLRSWMHSSGCQNVVELSWWERHELVTHDDKRFRFVCVPAQHWSKRGILDDNKVCILRFCCVLFASCFVAVRHR